jgi:hypothetical protein
VYGLRRRLRPASPSATRTTSDKRQLTPGESRSAEADDSCGLDMLGGGEVERERDLVAYDQIAAAQRLLELHPVVTA